MNHRKHRTETRYTHDAIVVGARCAGAATAMLLARGGMRVLCVDRTAYGSDTLSTHAMMRTAAYQLTKWGIAPELASRDVTAVRTTTFHYESQRFPIPVKPSNGVEALYAPRRTLLDRLLVDAAREAGAEVRHGVRVSALLREGDRVAGVTLADTERGLVEARAPLTIGADGRRSSVARWVEAETLLASTAFTSCIYGYFQGVELDGYHWYYAAGIGAGAIPSDGGLTCVFVCMPPERYSALPGRDLESGFCEAVSRVDPHLAQRLKTARQVGNLRGFAGAPGYLKRSHGPGWALVGDAGYFRDPFTAHGISDAFRDAELLARAALSTNEGALSNYQRRRDELSQEFFQLTDRIASFDWTLPELQSLHKQLSQEMARELAALAALPAFPASLPLNPNHGNQTNGTVAA